MILVKFLVTPVPQEIGAHYALCGVSGITLFNEQDQEIMFIHYNNLISIREE